MKKSEKSNEEKQRNSYFKVGQSEIAELLKEVNQVRFSTETIEDDLIRFSDNY